jgi:hypothetical protein
MGRSDLELIQELDCSFTEVISTRNDIVTYIRPEHHTLRMPCRSTYHLGATF